MKKPSQFRVHAFLWHILFSSCIAAISSALVYLVWHPTPLAKAVGVSDIFLMMLAIDVILGPILTFAVAKEGKKSLKFDLSVIVLIQIGALIYGLHNIAVNRPVYMVYDIWRFEVSHANDLKPESLARAKEPYNHTGWLKPQWVGLREPANAEEKNKRLFDALNGVSPAMQPDLFAPIETNWAQLQKEGQELSKLKQFNPPEQVDKILAQYPEATHFIPMKATKVDMTVLINPKNQQIIKIVDLRPWE